MQQRDHQDDFPKIVKEYAEDYFEQVHDTFSRYMWPITCSILIGYNALIALWHLYTVFFYEYTWEKHYFVGFGLVISVFVVSYSHKHFIRRE